MYLITESLVRNIFACDHELALNYFAKSLYQTKYHSLSCIDDYAGYMRGQCHDHNLMGYHAKKPQANSKYYLHMDDDERFEAHHYQITLELSAHEPVCLVYILEGTEGVADHVEHSLYK